jgi:hypothetical protein
LGVGHFPSRVHALVWRNWGLVETERLASVLGAKAEQVLALGKAMGLPEPPPLSAVARAEWRARSAITVIRRNWHLLPYAQLLTLLGWDEERLAFTLREDDFLFIKLGSLKPKCAPVPWADAVGEGAAGEAMRRREEEIARLVREEFPGGNLLGRDPLFSFVQKLSAPLEGKPDGGKSGEAVAAKGVAGLRFCSSYFALYGDPLLTPELDPYPDGYLARLAAAGVNGVWLQGVLSKLAPVPWEQDAASAKRRENLRKLAVRAARFGIRVFLYTNEPRALPVAAFADKAEWRGVTEAGYATVCTSVPEVRAGIREAVATVCRDVPELGGFFTITASENLTNCWSHGRGQACPRCATRRPAEVIAEVNACIQEGIVAGGGRQQLIAWDWGWADAWAVEAVEKLPAGVAVMSVSEWSLPIERGGIKSEVGEYSMSAVGPGPRAQRTWAAARKRGLPVLAKIQAGVTWELSSVPYIPVLKNVAEHAANLKTAGVDGIMLGWTLGGHPSPNLEMVKEIFSGGSLEALAKRRHGERLAKDAVAFWNECSDAFREFPYHIQCVYQAPFQMGPANLLWGERTGYHATMVGLPYDDLAGWRAIYPPEIWAGQLEKVAAGFEAAVKKMRAAADEKVPAPLAEELRFAEAAALHWGSAASQARFVMARDAKAPADERRRWIEREIAAAKRLHALQSEDARIGFEASNQYYYVPLDLVEKVVCCRWLEKK